MIGETVSTALLQKALDGTWQRQRAISDNIANHETPGYKAKKVSFENILAKEAKKLTNKFDNGQGMDNASAMQKIEDVHVTEYETSNTTERADGNNVDLDLENIEMAKTQIQYQYLVRSLTDTYSRLRYAISEGRK
ncbi:MAG: flagellar basal body rod protein FlgB [Eubacteriales bacterium]